MRKSFLVLWLLFFGAGAILFGQEPVIVVQTSGIVEYLSGPNTLSRRLFPGEQIPPDGFIRFNDGARVKLLFQGQPRALDQGGTYDLRELLREVSQGRSLNFISRFWDFVSEGILNTSSGGELKQYQERYSSRAGGIRGFADKEHAISTFPLTRGRLDEGEVTFRWAPSHPDSIYQLSIYRQADQVLRFQALTRDTALNLDFRRFYFTPGEVYYWIVGLEGTEIRSVERTFVVDPGATLQALESLHASAEYQSASETEQGLMEAFALEKQSLVFAADERYRKLRELSPDNTLIRRLYVAFLARQAPVDVPQGQR